MPGEAGRGRRAERRNEVEGRGKRGERERVEGKRAKRVRGVKGFAFLSLVGSTIRIRSHRI